MTLDEQGLVYIFDLEEEVFAWAQKPGGILKAFGWK
jgi:hypothetical protein